MNSQAQKQLKIGMRNNFNISSKNGGKADSTENESLHHLGNFYTDPRQVLHPIREDSLDEFLLNLQTTKNGQLQYCVLCKEQIYSLIDHYRLHFPGSLRCEFCDQAFTTQYHLTLHNASTHTSGTIKCESNECQFTTRDPHAFCRHLSQHMTLNVPCKHCRGLVQEIPEGYWDHSHSMKLHALSCAFAPRPYNCDSCTMTFTSANTLIRHKNKIHIEGQEIDTFSTALGLRPGAPVTPDELRQILCRSSERETISVDFDFMNDSISRYDSGDESSDPKMKSYWSLRHANCRPSDAAIAKHVLAPKSVTQAGDPYSIDDEIRMIKLREEQGLTWVEIAKHFPNRKKGNISFHYSKKLRKVSDISH